MKLLLSLLLLTPLIAFSQQHDSTMVDQYCRMQGHPQGHKYVLEVTFGESRRYPKQFELKNGDGSQKTFTSIEDGLNILGAEGWTLVTASNFANFREYIFKKRVLKSVVQAAENQ